MISLLILCCFLSAGTMICSEKKFAPMHESKITLKAYETKMMEFISCTPKNAPDGVKTWLDSSLSYVPLSGNILEIGSAFGREVDYIQAKGYKVICTDAAQSFVNYLNEHGYKAHKLNIITDELNQKYDFVLANTVFLHFTRTELDYVIGKIYDSLNENGILSFNLKVGDGDQWTTAEDDKLHMPRYFCYWREQAITQLLIKHNFHVVSAVESGPMIMLIAQKSSSIK